MLQQDELVEKLDKYLDDSGVFTPDQAGESDLYEQALPAMEATKSILQDVYAYQPPTGGWWRQIKNKIIGLIRNITISTVELVVIKQNKYNEINYRLISKLIEDNQKLRQEIDKLQQHE